MVAVGAKVADGGFGENFPAFTTVRASAVRFDGEDIVEKEDSLRLPAGEVARTRAGACVAEVAQDFFINIDKRRRNGLRLRDGEGETHGGAGSVIGVLAEDDDFDLIEVGGEGRENLRLGGKNLSGLIGVMEKRGKCLEIGFVKLGIKKGSPRVVH